MNQKEMTKHLRDRIKKSGIVANVNMLGDCIRVISKTYETPFTLEQCAIIKMIAKVNGLKGVMSTEINESVLLEVNQFNFYMR